MGAVYLARQKSLDRTVALKILPPELGLDLAFADRFTREAQAMARLSHPYIVTIHEFGRRGPFYFFVMEYVDGLSLRALLDSGHMSPREALAIVPQICEALQYAHDQGIVHRDIKPENLLLTKAGQIKIADFGLAKLIGAAATQITESVVGTPQYMAPEQKDRPAEVDHRADIYALGVVFYQMLTGELPRHQLTPPSQRVQIDVRLDQVVLRALEQQPARRYQQASEIKTDVENITTSPSPNGHPLHGNTTSPPFHHIALGLLILSIITTPLFLSLTRQHEYVLAFGLITLLLSLIFGLLSRHQRQGRIVARLAASFVLLLVVTGLAIAYEGTLYRLFGLSQARVEPRNPAVSGQPTLASTQTTNPKSADQIMVEDLSLDFIAAIRDKNDAKLTSLATNEIKQWPASLPHFALELRERALNLTGEELHLFPTESAIAGNRAVVRCTGSEKLRGVCLILYWVKTEQGWKNWLFRNAPETAPLVIFLKPDPSTQPSSR